MLRPDDCLQSKDKSDDSLKMTDAQQKAVNEAIGYKEGETVKEIKSKEYVALTAAFNLMMSGIRLRQVCVSSSIGC